MQTWMLRLDGFLRRHRRPVLIAWIVVLVVAAPFAIRQSEDLSSGGFRVPGSDSTAVTAALTRFPGGQSAQLAVVLVPRPGASVAQLRAAADRVAAGVAPIREIELAPADRRRALEQAQPGRTLVIPLRASTRTPRSTSPRTSGTGSRSATGRGPA
jgi:hypothetical protein